MCLPILSTSGVARPTGRLVHILINLWLCAVADGLCRAERCFLPLEVGSGGCVYTGNTMTRFHWSGNTCISFTYTGCGGNANNFVNKFECMSLCDPDSIARRQQPVLIPARCVEPRDSGWCTESKKMFYYDVTTNTCTAMQYTGCGGNLNRFTSKKLCKSHCTGIRAGSRCELAKSSGHTRCATRGRYKRWFWNGKSCKSFSWRGCGGNDNRFTSFYECALQCNGYYKDEPTLPEDLPESCREPLDSGLCTKYVSAWYYNIYTEACRSMIYTGCDGNNNRFQTEASCVATCEDFPVPCQQPVDQGQCTDGPDQALTRYFWTGSQCEAFIYKGCGGNRNRFTTEMQCLATCHPTYGHSVDYSIEKCQVADPSLQEACISSIETFLIPLSQYPYNSGIV